MASSLRIRCLIYAELFGYVFGYILICHSLFARLDIRRATGYRLKPFRATELYARDCPVFQAVLVDQIISLANKFQHLFVAAYRFFSRPARHEIYPDKKGIVRRVLQGQMCLRRIMRDNSYEK